MCNKDTCPLKTENDLLKAEIEALKKELEKYQNPPKDSSNSSLPPSTDKKPNKYPDKEKSWKKSGGQKGHKGKTKYMADNPDETVKVFPTECEHCGCKHILNTEKVLERRQKIDLPPIVPYVVEYQQIAGQCTKCGKRVVKDFPEDIKSSVAYGNNITAAICYLSVFGQMGYEKISKCFADLFNCPISEGTINNKLVKASKLLEPTYNKILNLLKNSDVVGSDETHLRITAKNAYSWVFQNKKLTYLTYSFSRAFSVIENLFGKNFKGAWTSDRYAAQLKIEAHHQLCLPHLIRDFKYVVEAEKSKFAQDLLNLCCDCIKFRQEKGSNYDPSKHYEPIMIFKNRMRNIFSKAPPQKKEKTLFKGLVGRQKELLLFLDNPLVPFDNNGSERALRNIVTKRKVSNGFRSEEGAKVYCIIASVFQTFQKQGYNLLSSIIELLNGKNILLQT